MPNKNSKEPSGENKETIRTNISHESRSHEGRTSGTPGVATNRTTVKGKKKSSSVCEEPITKPAVPTQTSASTCTLNTLDDNDFRNLLYTASRPLYNSNLSKIKTDSDGNGDCHGTDNLEGEQKLTAEADIILARARLEADIDQRKADIDIESERRLRTVTAFIGETEASANNRMKLTKSSSQDSWQLQNRSAASGRHEGSMSGKQIPHIRTRSSGPNVSETPQLFSSSKNKDCTVVDVKSLLSIVSPEQNSINAPFNYIDDDDDHSDSEKSIVLNTHTDVSSGARIQPQRYVQGNVVQEMRPLNDSDGTIYSSRTNSVGRLLDTKFDSQYIAVNGSNDKHSNEKRDDFDDNSFPYTSGQLHMRSNKHGSYEMTSPLQLSVSNIDEGNARGVLSNRIVPQSTLLDHTLKEADFQPHPQYLQPTENTRLSPYQALQETDMANTKGPQQDKCALAKQRRSNKKAKENKHVYVVEYKTSDGYMGNLSTEEILKRIEGEDSTNKTKNTQRSNGRSLSKDHPNSVAVSGSKTVIGVKKKSEKQKRSTGTDKHVSPKQSIDNSGACSPLMKPRIKMNGDLVQSSGEDMGQNSSVPFADVQSGDETESNTGVRTGDKTGIHSSEQSSEGDSGATVGVADEELNGEEGDADDEEQYMSADEGVNSAASDDVYHTDELSTAWGSRDLMSDGANYRADNEVVVPNSVRLEEAEFIEVTAKSKKKFVPIVPVNEKRTSSVGGAEKSGAQRQGAAHSENVQQRRNSAQLTVDTTLVRSTQSPSPNDHKKFSGPPNRRQLNSLADFIEDNTIIKGQGHKPPHYGSKTYMGQHKSSSVNSEGNRGAKMGPSSSLQSSRAGSPDRRASQPASWLPGRYAAAVAHSHKSNNQSDLTVNTTGLQGCLVKGLVSPPHSDQHKNNYATVSSSTAGSDSSLLPDAVVATQQSAVGAALNKTVYDPSDEQANPPLPSAANPSAILPSDMTNSSCMNACGNGTSSNARSWADIAKSKSPAVGMSRASNAPSQCSPRETSPDLNTPSTSTLGDNCTPVTGQTETSKECDQQASCSTGSDNPITSASAAEVNITESNTVDDAGNVQGFSFFYDPNEPTTICDEQLFQPDDQDTPFICPHTGDDAVMERGATMTGSENCVNANEQELPRKDKLRSSNMDLILNLEGGKTIILSSAQSLRTNNISGIERGKHIRLSELLTEQWNAFQDKGSVPTLYKDIFMETTDARNH